MSDMRGGHDCDHKGLVMDNGVCGACHEKIDDLTTWEWSWIETALDSLITTACNMGMGESEHVGRLQELRNKIRGRGEQ